MSSSSSSLPSLPENSKSYIIALAVGIQDGYTKLKKESIDAANTIDVDVTETEGYKEAIKTFNTSNKS